MKEKRNYRKPVNINGEFPNSVIITNGAKEMKDFLLTHLTAKDRQMEEIQKAIKSVQQKWNKSQSPVFFFKEINKDLNDVLALFPSNVTNE